MHRDNESNKYESQINHDERNYTGEGGRFSAQATQRITYEARPHHRSGLWWYWRCRGDWPALFPSVHSGFGAILPPVTPPNSPRAGLPQQMRSPTLPPEEP